MLEIRETLKKLVNKPSPSGWENSTCEVFKGLISPFVDSCEVDTFGNLICRKNSLNATQTLMLIAHMDEVGMMVKYIEESGHIRFTNVGGLDPGILRGLNVVLYHNGKEVQGVIGMMPIHMRPQKQNKDLDISDLWIDIGAKNKEDAEKYVTVGDYICYNKRFVTMPNGLISCGALDDKIGLTILSCLLSRISVEKMSYNLLVVASAQEEVGARGAGVVAFTQRPDVCIAIDVTHATDYPMVEKRKHGEIKINGGVVIPYGTDYSHTIQNRLKVIAEEASVTYQIEARPGHSGTDIHSTQISGQGCYTGLISIPCRYMHTPIEIVSEDDAELAICLLAKFLQQR